MVLVNQSESSFGASPEEKEDRDRPEAHWLYTASDDGNLKILAISHQRELIVTRSKPFKGMKMKETWSSLVVSVFFYFVSGLSEA